mgnify:CR=1 FL=1
MKNTALTHVHEALGAKIVPFAGYNMPVSYEGINIEHETVRKAVGVFDVSHMGEFFITGPQSIEFIDFMVTNDIANNFEWSVNPPNFVFVNGTDASSFEPQMSFTKEGCYTVSLTAWNDRNTNATSRTILKGNYICVLDYCKP